MSRYCKVAPNGRCVVLDDGYQLCARCGDVHCTNDRVVVVYRSPWWGIHTHVPGPDCRAKAVSGWRAVEFALDMQKSNVPTPREAHPTSINGFTLPCVSLLDDEHCSAEMAAVTISRKEFLPSESSLYAGDKDRGDFLTDVFEDRYGQRDWGLWQRWQVGIVAVAAVRGKLAEITRDVLRQERTSLQVKRSDSCSVMTLSERDERPIRRITYSAGSGLTSLFSRAKPRTSQGKSRKRKVPSREGTGYASSRDGLGRLGEFALYSQQKLTDGRRVLSFGGLALDDFGLYRRSGPKPQPARLPFDSVQCPEMFDWSADKVPKGLVEHWKNNPKSSPYGPVAHLKPAYLGALRKPY